MTLINGIRWLAGSKTVAQDAKPVAEGFKRGAILLAAAVSFIGGFEGERLVPYRDAVGVLTVCDGETQGVKSGQHFTHDQCQTMLGTRLVEFSLAIDKCIKNNSAVPNKVYEAVLSLSYNIGTGAFCGSTMNKYLSAGNWKAACNEFPKWDRAGGKVLPGLLTRRLAEQKLCLSGAT